MQGHISPGSSATGCEGNEGDTGLPRTPPSGPEAKERVRLSQPAPIVLIRTVCQKLGASRVQQLVPLLLPLHSLDSLLVHLLGHLLEPLALFLGRSLVFDSLYAALNDLDNC